MNGLNLDAGMNVTGTWENPRNGERVFARDIMMEDNQVLVMTSNGRVIPYNTFQNFVKISDKNVVSEAKKPKKAPQKKKTQSNTSLLSGLETTANIQTDLTNDWVDPSIFEVTNERRINSNQHPTTPVSNAPFSGSDNKLIKMNENVLKALDNLSDDEKPIIDVNFVWSNDEVLQFIYKYLKATPEEVVDCLIYKFVNTSTILDAVTKTLNERLGVEVVDGLKDVEND